MATKIKNIATGEVREIKNTGVTNNGELYVLAQAIPGNRWRENNPMFTVTGNTFGGGSYTKWEIILNKEWELCTTAPTRTRKVQPKQEPVTTTVPESQEPQTVQEPDPIVQGYAMDITAGVEHEALKQELRVKYGTMGEDIFAAAVKLAGVVQPQTAGVDEEAVERICAAYMDEWKTSGRAMVQAIVKEEVASQAPRTIEVKSAAGVAQINGVVAENFGIYCNLVNAGKPLYMYGPAGCGKSYTAKQIADALKFDYYETSQAMFAHELKGYGDAKGEFVPTAFYRAFANGGVFFLDEVDASAPEALVVLNNAIANKRFDFPVIGNVTAHKDFRVIAAGNTRMTGATLAYTARQMQDTSFKNRFFFEVVGYDERIEKQIAGGDMEIVEFAHDLRKAARETQIIQLCSYRQIEDLATLQECCGGDDAHLLRGSVLQEKEVDEVNILYSHLTNKDNRWAKAMQECIRIIKNENIW